MNRSEARQKAEALVAKMTVVEAASQLRYDAPAIEHLGVPAYNWWNEALHGVARAGTATSFPQAIAMAATFDRDTVQKMGDMSATEGRAKYNASAALEDRDIYKGLTFWTPNINIFRDPRWGRGHETYGEDPYLTAELGKSCIRGLQGDGETLKSAACAKHFAVHSGPEGLRHSFNVDIDRRSMEETYLPAFRAAVQEADVESVMGAYNAVNGAPCCGSQELLRDILREEWGFQGHVVSDCWAVRDFHEHHKVTDTPAESTAMALNAGCDLNCGCSYRCLITALMQGQVSEESIRQAAVRLFTTRYRLGIMGEGSEFDSIPFEAVECPEHLAAAREAAQRSCVLLDNKGILPLDKSRLKTVGVVGPNANSRAALVGNYHGTASRYVTVLEGIQDELGEEVRVLYAEGCHLFKDRVEPLAVADDRIQEAVQVANHSDVTILVLGLDETLEGEQGDTGNADASGDKMSLLLPECQRKLADAVLATGKPVILCLMVGSSIDISAISEKAQASLLLWYPGARGGRTAADILFGKVSPSGKLPVTFYREEDLEKMPEFTDYTMENRTYKFMDFAPLYPFGYGLTYGDVKLTSAQRVDKETEVIITAQVKNQGSRTTEEVVQVYVQNEGSPLAPRNPRLCGFQRISCPLGETVSVELHIPAAALLVVDSGGNRVADGTPVFYTGLGQPDKRTTELTGTTSIKL